MYLDHFGLTVNPFGLSPRLDFLYKSGAFEESMAHLLYGLDNSEAIILITGAIGTGKTMSINSFLSHLGGRFKFALITNTKVTAKELLKLVLEDLDVAFPAGCDKSDLLILFKGELLAARNRGQRILIVVDEAQNLDTDVLEEVRLLTNLGQGESQPVQIILAGQPELEEIINRPELAQLRQRIRVHYRLDALTRSEVEEYINHRMKIAGCAIPIFERKSLDRIFAASGGVPRVVNTMAGEALLSAFVDGRKQVREQDVEMPVSPGEAPEVPDWTHIAPALSSAKPTPDERPVAAPPVEKAAKKESETKPAPMPEYGRRHHERRNGRSARQVAIWLLVGVSIIAGATYLYRSGGLPFGPARLKKISAAAQGIVPQAAPPAAEAVAAAPDEVPADAAVVAATPDSGAAGSDYAAMVAGNAAEAAPAVSSAAPLGFAAHVCSFRDRARAESVVAELAGRHIAAFVSPHQVPNGRWFRVCLGPFALKDTALDAAKDYNSDAHSSYYKIIQVSDVPIVR